MQLVVRLWRHVLRCFSFNLAICIFPLIQSDTEWFTDPHSIIPLKKESSARKVALNVGGRGKNNTKKKQEKNCEINLKNLCNKKYTIFFQNPHIKYRKTKIIS